MGLVQHFQRQAVDQLLEARVVLVAGEDAADRELAAQVFEGGAVGGLGVLELFELAHEFIGAIVVEAVVSLADLGAQFADLVAFLGGLESIEDHLTDGLGLGDVL